MHVPASTSSNTLDKKALVTGASRGIGASVARQLGRLGVDVALNYRSKGPRAQEVADELVALGRQALPIQGDITSAADLAATFDQIRALWGHLDLLVLNASGGLEQDKAADYAMQLNLTAQINLVHGALPLMPRGGRIVFVTSHLVHFYRKGTGYDGYETVAASKRAGEDALRAMIPSLSELGIRLVIVSGDLIEGTITPKLLERQSRGLIEKRRQAVGALPGVEEFAAAIVQAGVGEEYASGDTIYVGSTEL
ncbi:SDR family oxidoreductase [Terriglobus saanensis]|uniref:Short-chain dehydrogenase/reductase SDR n=1 Tax=Terriglobus saanensis (strain ATCC BAA-1853 / DSM 23119 / SP1PR4) TaxID=401053 RepID=E8V322_TERSS|nr:SDR family oxidoreductase [Terriglobus saanensis]ADV81297.1 short-chain dehydrogenase/reductase SDR [Terriglobus saanensis SP1PR4]